MNLIIFIAFLVFTYFYGRHIEQKHLKELRIRENTMKHLPWSASGKKKVYETAKDFRLLFGSVVIAQDRFKSFMAALVNILGGKVTVYESLLDRGRREAICRLKENALSLDCDEIVNVRLETSTLGLNQGKNAGGVIEVIAYGTGLKS